MTCIGLTQRSPGGGSVQMSQHRRRRRCNNACCVVLALLLLSSQLAGIAQAACCESVGFDASDTYCVHGFDTSQQECYTFFDASSARYDPTAVCTDDPNGGVPRCQAPSVPPAASGDPHIKGFDGTDYLLWGKPNTTYNLLSERSLQVNIHLYHPPGRADAHALYIDSVGILVHGATIAVHLVPPVAVKSGIDVSTSAAAVSQEALAGPATMTMYVNGATQAVAWAAGHSAAAERAIDAHTAYILKSAREIVIVSTDIRLSAVLMENDHLDVHVEEVAAHWGDVHGVMGQTHKKAFRLNYNYAKGRTVGDMPDSRSGSKKQYSLQGTEDDYITSGLLSTDDKFTRFVPGSAATASSSSKTITITRKLKQNVNQLVAHARSSYQRSVDAAGFESGTFGSGSTVRVKTVAGIVATAWY